MRNGLVFLGMLFVTMVFTPIISAAKENRITIVQLAMNGDVAGVKARIESGENINAIDASTGETALTASISEEKFKVASYLIAAHADVNQPNKFGNTPLIYASTAGNAKITRSLLDAGASVNGRGERGLTPILMACGFGNLACVDILLSTHADVNLATLDKLTPLMLAAGGGWQIENGFPGKPLITIIAFYNNRTAELLTQKLLNSGARINDADARGMTPLMYADRMAFKNTARILLNAGADAKIRDLNSHFANDYIRIYRNVRKQIGNK
jgi:ankyrin repeat protein